MERYESNLMVCNLAYSGKLEDLKERTGAGSPWPPELSRIAELHCSGHAQ